MAKKYVNVGKVIAKKSGDGNFIALGNPNAKDKRFAYNVDIRITDSEGKPVGLSSNPMLFVQDPRNRPGITPEQAAKIPANIKFELVLVLEE